VKARTDAILNEEKKLLAEQGKALDKQLKLSDEYIKTLAYRGNPDTSTFLKYFTTVQQREKAAYQKGIREYDDYTSKMKSIGQVSYDTRMKQHDNYIKKLERSGDWSY